MKRTPKPPPSAFACRIESGREWKDWPGRAEALAELDRWRAWLCAEWRLPAPAASEWRISNRAHWPAPTLVRVTVGSDPRGAVVRLPPPAEAAPVEVAAAFAQAVIGRRQQWFDAELAALSVPGAALPALLQATLARGHAPWRLADPHLPDDLASADERVDELLGGECLRLRVQLRDLAIVRQPDAAEDPWPALAELLDDGLYYELGLMTPLPELEVDPAMPADRLRIWINDLPLPLQPMIGHDQVLVNDTPERLRLLDLQGSAWTNPANGSRGTLLPAADVARARDAGLTTWDAAGYLVLALAAAMRRHAALLWSNEATEAALDAVGAAQPALVGAWRDRFSVPLLTALLRRLLDEQVAVRRLRTVLEAMLAVQGVALVEEVDRIVFPPLQGHLWVGESGRPQAAERGAALDLDAWVEQVRGALARSLARKFANGQHTLMVYLLSPALERKLRERPALLEGAEGHLKLVAALHDAIGDSATGQPPVMLTARSARAALHRLLAADWPDLVVLAYEELPPEMSIQPLARVEWAD